MTPRTLCLTAAALVAGTVLLAPAGPAAATEEISESIRQFNRDQAYGLRPYGIQPYGWQAYGGGPYGWQAYARAPRGWPMMVLRDARGQRILVPMPPPQPPQEALGPFPTREFRDIVNYANRSVGR